MRVGRGPSIHSTSLFEGPPGLTPRLRAGLTCPRPRREAHLGACDAADSFLRASFRSQGCARYHARLSQNRASRRGKARRAMLGFRRSTPLLARAARRRTYCRPSPASSRPEFPCSHPLRHLAANWALDLGLGMAGSFNRSRWSRSSRWSSDRGTRCPKAIAREPDAREGCLLRS